VTLGCITLKALRSITNWTSLPNGVSEFIYTSYWILFILILISKTTPVDIRGSKKVNKTVWLVTNGLDL